MVSGMIPRWLSFDAWEGASFVRRRIGDGFRDQRRGRISCDARVSDRVFGEVLRPSLGPRISATRIAHEAPLSLTTNRP